MVTEQTPSSDLLTVIAIAILAYVGANITHEIIGHCGTGALLGAKCSFISTTEIRFTPQLSYDWRFRIGAFAGSGANWLVALICRRLLRAWRSASPALRFFLWLSTCVNLFLPSTYLLVSPVIRFGDWYSITIGLSHPFFWRSGMIVAGALACWLSFRLCSSEMSKLIGIEAKHARSTAWSLVIPAYLAGGIISIAAAVFGPLPLKWALFISGSMFGVTFLLLLLPLRIQVRTIPIHDSFVIPRSVRWLVVGILVAAAFVFVLGPGFSL
ncbi:MAG TPA: hypothetical protein VK582_09460 [Pyrinomonadaceae bacterium]|nr:hypothetical protein [Pyrinomonadaceae bacterium]